MRSCDDLADPQEGRSLTMGACARLLYETSETREHEVLTRGSSMQA